MLGLFKKVLMPANQRALKNLQKVVSGVNFLENEFTNLTDVELANKTAIFRNQVLLGRSPDDLICEAFAAVREASKRVLGMRHFDVQIIGGAALHKGMIAEMKTGEGKTLVATLAAYLNALSGSKVHIVTVNGYLAKRDAEWMGMIYKFLGMSVGYIVHEHSDTQRRDAYKSDVLYTTNNDVGFDYLRDNLKFSKDDMVQCGLDYAIIDEVDSILIDEARTPLIISDSSDESDKEMYALSNEIVKQLDKTHFEIDEKNRSAMLTDDGVTKVEELARERDFISKTASLFDIENTMLVHYINQSLRAQKLFVIDKDYIVSSGQILIVDEFTGRAMKGRRFSDGLHQAIEAKENVTIQPESKTLASTTFQNYFRLYKKLSGMTGTAHTEQSEFWETYGLEVIQIPTNMHVRRKDLDDEIYRTEKEKLDAAVKIIEDCHARKQPVLVGTASIEKSEKLSEILKRKSLNHSVLNARYHEMEAGIIAQAGRPGAITIATNMAGRGTDIKLGGNFEMLLKNISGKIEDKQELEKKTEELKLKIEADKEETINAGGLYVLGTERHESRRIDDQLRGRSGRQGDPGMSKFIISLEDDLLRIFGSHKIKDLLLRLGMQEGEAIRHPWINKSIERAQKKVESRNYEVRKSLLKFDDAVNQQRTVVFDTRNKIIEQEVFDYQSIIKSFNSDIIDRIFRKCGTKSHSEIDYIEYVQAFSDSYGEELFTEDELKNHNSNIPEFINEKIVKIVSGSEDTINAIDSSHSQEPFIRELVLTALDYAWREHLSILDALRHGISLRAIGQKDPLNEFKKEAFAAFQAMLSKWKEQSVKAILNISRSVHGASKADMTPPQISGTRMSRNALCPCGSGKRYKHCHGQFF